MELTIRVPAAERLPLVVGLLASGQGDGQLGVAALVDGEPCGHNGHPLCLHGAVQLLQLAGRQQKLTVALGRVVVVCPVHILGNVQIANPQLAVDKEAVRIHQACVSLAYRLDLRSHQHDTRRVILQQFVLKGSLTILGNYFLSHDFPLCAMRPRHAIRAYSDPFPQ